MQRKTAECSSRTQRSARPLERRWGDRSARSASRLLLLLCVVEGGPAAHVPAGEGEGTAVRRPRRRGEISAVPLREISARSRRDLGEISAPLSARALVDGRRGDALLGQHACVMGAPTSLGGEIAGRSPCAHRGPQVAAGREDGLVQRDNRAARECEGRRVQRNAAESGRMQRSA